MATFRDDVVKAMVLSGWGPNGARMEVLQSDAGYVEGLQAAGMTADRAAAQVIRDALVRQSELSTKRAA